MLLRIKSSSTFALKDKSRIVLAGDVGATKTNLALFKSKGNTIVSIAEQKFLSKEYKSITEIIEIFLKKIPLPDSICFGVAGPVMNGRAKLSNISWDIDSNELSRYFTIKKVKLINDLEANAYGLAMLNEKDVVSVHSVKNAEKGNVAIIAPGTGLGGQECTGTENIITHLQQKADIVTLRHAMILILNSIIT